MTRLFSNFLRGNIDTAVSDTDTTLSSPDFADMPVISSPDVMALTLDPLATAPEIVHVTDHAADSTNVTVTRGERNTTASSHDVDTAWVHAATDFDYVPIDRTNVVQGSLLQVKNANPLELEHLDSGTYRKARELLLAPEDMRPVQDTVSFGHIHRHGVWLMPADTSTRIGRTIRYPTPLPWSPNILIEFWWVSAGADAGTNVLWELWARTTGDGGSIGWTTSQDTKTVAANGEDVLTKTTFSTFATGGDELLTFEVRRKGDDGSDTHSQTVGILQTRLAESDS